MIYRGKTDSPPKQQLVDVVSMENDSETGEILCLTNTAYA